MKRRRHCQSKSSAIWRRPRLLGEGMGLPEATEQREVAEATYRRWRAQCGGMKANDVRRLKELEIENARLKRIVADQTLEVAALKVVAKGDWWARRAGAVVILQDRLGTSERRACRIVGRARPDAASRRARRA